VSVVTGTDDNGRPVVARLDLGEILQEEVPDEEARTKLLYGVFAPVNNYYAKRITRCMNDMAVYAAIAASSLPKD
jgi:hypothetical protein